MTPDQPTMLDNTGGLTDADVRGAMLRAMRLAAILCVAVAAAFWWRAGWQAALLVVIGTAISAASLWEWLRLITAMNRQMDGSGQARPMGLVVGGFLFRLVLTVAVLYGSLKYLHGTAFALAAGLGLGVVALTVQAVRLLKAPAV